MGCSQSCNLESGDWTEDENSGKTEVGSSGSVLDASAMKIICRKPRWDLGLGRRRSEKSEEENRGLENNRAWLLADSNVELKEGVLEYQEPQSIHSSFRFSFGSQVELDGLSFNNPNPSATVLLVNLEKGSENRAVEAGSIDLQWRRIQSLERSVSPVAESLIRFSYSEVQSATNHFSRGKVLGRGAHSCVFRGSLRFGRAVAIKQLDDKDKESAKNFCRELLIASSLENKNVVPLLGFCIDPQGLFLIYKFVSGGSLEHHLHDKKRSKSFLSWSVRYRVAIGIAQALAYLHNGTEKCVVHRDIKPSNVLLSSKKTAKLCDFGLATWTHGPSIPFLCKTVKGTFGYLAPEYFQHGKVSDKTDVYAFGVVLLELLTGRKPIETRKTQGEENLVLWAKPLLMHEGTELKLLDPRIRQVSYSSKQVSRMVRAAAACINSEESRRPNMEKVLGILRGEDQRSSVSEKLVLELHDQETKSEMKSHLALAMLGVSDFEEDDPHCR